MPDDPVRHIVAKHFSSVYVYHHTIVSQDSQFKGIMVGDVRDIKVLPEIVGDGFVLGIRTIIQDG